MEVSQRWLIPGCRHAWWVIS